MHSCLSNKHDAALEEGCVFCIELLIMFTAFGYRAILKRNGTVIDRKDFETPEQVLSWANAIIDLAGEDLYVKLSSHGGRAHQAVQLGLASVLARRGCLVGSNNLRFICRLAAEHLE